MKEKMDEISTDVKAIKRALLGDEFNEEGLIETVRRLKRRVTTIERRLMYYAAFAAGFGSAATILVNYLLTK